MRRSRSPIGTDLGVDNVAAMLVALASFEVDVESVILVYENGVEHRSNNGASGRMALSGVVSPFLGRIAPSGGKDGLGWPIHEYLTGVVVDDCIRSSLTILQTAGRHDISTYARAANPLLHEPHVAHHVLGSDALGSLGRVLRVSAGPAMPFESWQTTSGPAGARSHLWRWRRLPTWHWRFR